MKAFVVYDSAAEAYGIPFFMSTTGEAVRGFMTEAKNPQSRIGQYPSDFTLFEIGGYNQLNAEIETLPTPKSLGKALEYVKKES